MESAPVLDHLPGSQRNLVLALWVTGWRVTDIRPIPGTCRAVERGWRPGAFRGMVRFYGPFGIPLSAVTFGCPGGVDPG